jgi:hypothetical protein
MLARVGAKIVLEVQPPLKPLLASFEGALIVARGEPLPAFDLHCPILSLPLAFKAEQASIPASIPYLQAPHDRVEKWKQRLPRQGELVVAIAWSESATHEQDLVRSIAIEKLAPLLAIPDIQWISIQRDLRPGDAEFLAVHPKIAHVGAELADFADTAAVLSQADLTISVDTSTVHLAGIVSVTRMARTLARYCTGLGLSSFAGGAFCCTGCCWTRGCTGCCCCTRGCTVCCCWMCC